MREGRVSRGEGRGARERDGGVLVYVSFMLYLVSWQ